MYFILFYFFANLTVPWVNLYTLSQVAKCDTCSQKGKLKQNLPLLGDVKHFCDLTCLLQFCCDNVTAHEEIFKRKVFLLFLPSCIADIYFLILVKMSVSIIFVKQLSIHSANWSTKRVVLVYCCAQIPTEASSGYSDTGSANLLLPLRVFRTFRHRSGHACRCHWRLGCRPSSTEK